MTTPARSERLARIAALAEEIWTQEFGTKMPITREIVMVVDKARRAEYYERKEAPLEATP